MSTVRFGPFSLDCAKRRLERNGIEIRLQPKVFETLLYLVEHPGRVIPRDEFLDRLWPDTFVGEAALTRCVKEVRRALGDRASEPRFVSTVPSVGYRFDARLERAAATRGGEVRVLAVLPLRPVSGDVGDPGLELGMADTLITRLSGLRELVVRPLATVRRYSDIDQDPLVAGRELGVDAVLEGTLQRLGGRIRVSVRVLRCEDGRALFAEQYDESFGDVFEVQDAVCRRITSAVEVRLDPVEAERIGRHETNDLRAYRHYLRGRLGLGRMVPEEARWSIGHFEKALAIDPAYAQALVSIAEANIVLAWQGLETSRYYDRARRAARAALDHEPLLGSAWSWLATVAWEHDWDWADADRKFERAVELTPNVVDVWGRYSASCAFSGRRDKAVRLARRAVEVDRTSPMATAWLVQALHMAGRSDEAVEAGEAVLGRASDAPFLLFILGVACLQVGQLDRALGHLERAAATGRPDFLGVLAHAYVRAGRHEDASALESSLRADAAPPIAFAMIHAARGETDLFFDAIEKTFEQPGLHSTLIATEPLLGSYRADPRAERLIHRLGLPPVH
jgi:DNA-binding winged helix-turn-helix (wHTH) protein/tetratricopeptide (TPR) repeat protein